MELANYVKGFENSLEKAKNSPLTAKYSNFLVDYGTVNGSGRIVNEATPTIEETKPAPNPEIPNTDATVNNVNSNGWFAVMLTLSMGLSLVMTTSKKRVFSK